jgi:membrane-bound lytic murein transglycosylase D
MKKIIMSFATLILLSTNVGAAKISEQKVNVFYKNNRFKNSIAYCISRAEKKQYFNFIKSTFKRHRLPYELIYLPVIESCFNPYAESPKGALGMWQINDITAKHVGLKEGFFTDERYNWKKSTVAAAKYLLFLRERFDNWELTIAAYNVGPTFLRNQIQKYNTNDIEKLRLPRETRDYVYKFKALIKYTKKSRS